MKLIICFLFSLILAFSSTLSVNAASRSKTTCVCKHVKHHKHHKTSYHTSKYYSPGYCVDDDPTTCNNEQACYPGTYYRCKTDFYYHHGRNTSRVEVCTEQ